MSFITGFIERNQTLLQLLGSVVLAAFGAYLFQGKNPARALKTPSLQVNTHGGKDMVTGFLFTFSNPLILFFIIGLSHGLIFCFQSSDTITYMSGLHRAYWLRRDILVVYVITFSVNKIARPFPMCARYIWSTRVIGSLLIVFSIVGAAMSLMDYVRLTVGHNGMLRC